ncbi:UNVERIFIED_CONTAM: hypothetical protein GTU68_000588 [Idotea baltica]|nr:hypothetical protein [Idotea baltica]
MSDSPRIPYCRQSIGEEEIEAVTRVLRSGWITRGPLAKELESHCAELLQASHAIACTNGSAALEIALRGLGVGPGDHVIVPTLTWVATASAIRLVGAEPVFCDVDPVTHCATPDTVQAAWTPETKAVIVVDMCGVPCDIRGLRDLTRTNGAFLIEDAAHSFGAQHPEGNTVGSDGFADVATFSFHPAKTITTAEGGLVVCEDDAIAKRMRSIRSGGIEREFSGSRGGFDFEVDELGSNYHLSELHAAIGLVQLDRLEEFVQERRRLAQVITEQLRGFGDALILPEHPEGSCWNLFVVELNIDAEDSATRDALIAAMSAAGIAVHVHYPLLHEQPLFASAPPSGPFPIAERYERRAFTLPLFPGLRPEQITRVVSALGEILLPARAAI